MRRLGFRVSYRPLALEGCLGPALFTIKGCLIHQSNDPRNPHDLRLVRCSHSIHCPAMQQVPHALLRAGLPDAALEPGGHNRALCKRIKRAGGAEKYHADQKYNEAVAEAVETCSAHVPEGATCYICTEAVVQRTGEGLVNGFCACGDRDGVDAGTTGVAHVSCLVREAELAQDDDVELVGDVAR